MSNDSRAASAYAWLRIQPWRFDLALALAALAAAATLTAGSPQDFDSGWPEAAAGIGAFVLISLRRWHSFLLLAVALGWSAAHLLILDRPAPMIFATLVLLGTVCIRLERKRAIALGVGVGLCLYGVALTTTEFQLADERALIFVVWSMGVVGVADAIRSWRQFRAATEDQVRSAVLAADAQAKQQVSQERLTIARELHDLLAHNLSVMNVQTGAALHLLRSDVDQAEESLVVARDAGKGVLEELRELLAVLRHDGDSDSAMASLPRVDQLVGLVETMRSSGLQVRWIETGLPVELAPAVSLAAYRIAQEALTNAAKHGDGRADFDTSWDRAGLTIRIENFAGRHASQAGSGLGLVGMEERAVTNGGRFEAGAGNGRFSVEAWLPASQSSREKGRL